MKHFDMNMFNETIDILVLRWFESLRRAPSIICALVMSTSATPVFGIAVLQPILGETSTGMVGLVALAINLVMPMAIIFLEIESASSSGSKTSRRTQVLSGLKSGLQSPLLWPPVLGIALVLAGLHLPSRMRAPST